MKDDSIVNQSRQLKYFKHLDHINKELQHVFHLLPTIVFDGELYNHSISFNKIAGIVKKEKIQENDVKKLLQIEYHIYDCFIVNEKTPFYQRLDLLIDIRDKYKWKYVKFVPTDICNSPKEVTDFFHPRYIADNYEGVILRNGEANYEFTRTKHLQKYKTFQDDEFKIVDYKEGAGTDAGTVIWKCITTNGLTFDVRQKGSVEERTLLFKNAPKLIGKMLTVTFQELSEYGVPRFPVGKTIRDYE